MGEKFLDFFRSDKQKFQQQNKKEKSRVYQRENKTSTIYGKKRLAKQKQIHINFGLKRKSLISLSIIGLISATIGIVFLFKAEYFAVQNITIESPDSLTDINIAYDSIDSIRGNNIFGITYEDTINKLQLYQPNISNISLEKQLPNNIKITINSSPIGLEVFINEQYYLVSENGVAIRQKIKSNNSEIETIEIVEEQKTTFSNINYTQLLDPSTITKINFLLRSFKDNVTTFSVKQVFFYTKEAELHILLDNDTLIILDNNGDINEQVKKLIVFYQETQNLRKIYIDLRIPNKIFHCDYDNEYQCRQNLKKLYTKK